MKEDSIMQKIRKIRADFFDRCGGDLERMSAVLKVTEQKLRVENEKILKDSKHPTEDFLKSP